MGLCQSTRSTVDYRGLSNDLFRLCKRKSLSEDGLREIIERHGVTPNNNDVPNSFCYLFFIWACINERVTEGIIRYLLEYFPNAARRAISKGELPIHRICANKNVTLGMVQLLVDAFPDSLRHENKVGCMGMHLGYMPLHHLCLNKNLDGVVAVDILKLLVEKCPESVRHRTRGGIISGLPIHIGAAMQSPEFCRILIKAFPRSLRATDGGALPFHRACRYNTVATVKYLHQLYPESINVADNNGYYPIHHAIRGIAGLKNRCNSKGCIKVVNFLIDINPDALGSTGQTPLRIDSLRHQSNLGYMPLHFLCANKILVDENGLKILKLLLERYPESARRATIGGSLPIHLAAGFQSPEFCQVLIGAYPGSEQMADNRGGLPFHWACEYNTIATAKYLYQLYPESINVAANDGAYPIHRAIVCLKYRRWLDDATAVVEMVKFLLDCNPDVVLQKFLQRLPLYWVCREATRNTTKLNAYLKILQKLYDAYPYAIESNEVTSNADDFCQEVQTFIDIQLSFARQARDRALMAAPDENGQLALHKALRENITLSSTNLITLGSIKLLVKGNPSAVRSADNTGMLPLHVACQHHDSASVVEYLIDLDSTSLRARDCDDNTALHHACCGAKYDTIALLLGKYGGVSVSKRNSDKQLPIDLLLQNKNEVIHKMRSRTQYTDSIFQLIRAYPEILMRAH